MESETIKHYRYYKKAKLTNRIKLFITGAIFCSNISFMRSNIHEIKEIIYTDYIETSSSDSIDTIESIEYDKFIINLDHKYSKEELSHAKKVEINVFDNYDYSYLNDMTNLDTLIINDYSTKPVLTDVDGTLFKNKMNIEIYRKNFKQVFNKERFSFIKDIPYINSLILGKPCKMFHFSDDSPSKALLNVYLIKLNQSIDSLSYNIESNYLESLTNIHNLTLAVDPYFDYNYKNLSFLDSLYINGSIYDIPIFFSEKDINNLKHSGVDVKVDDYFGLIDVYNKIDKIIFSLDLNENSTDREVINKSLAYILNNCKYSSDKNLGAYNSARFYYNGYLRGALDSDEQICGNYAALLKTILGRFDIEADIIHSGKHAWDLVRLDDKVYYFDPTWLDTEDRYIISEKKYYALDENEKEVLIENYDKIPDIEVVRIEEEQTEYTVPELLNKYSDQIMNINWYQVEPTEAYKLDNIYHDPVFIPADSKKELTSDTIKVSDTKKLYKMPKQLLAFGLTTDILLVILFPCSIISTIRINKKIDKKIKELLYQSE